MAALVAHPTPTAAEAAALATAISAVLDEEAGAPIDPVPPAYRSGWRRRAIAEGLSRSPRLEALR